MEEASRYLDEHKPENGWATIKKTLLEDLGGIAGMSKYVVTKEGYSQIIVNMTEREARTLEKFIEWACLDDNYFVEAVDEYEAETWGEQE